MVREELQNLIPCSVQFSLPSVGDTQGKVTWPFDNVVIAKYHRTKLDMAIRVRSGLDLQSAKSCSSIAVRREDGKREMDRKHIKSWEILTTQAE